MVSPDLPLRRLVVDLAGNDGGAPARRLIAQSGDVIEPIAQEQLLWVFVMLTLLLLTARLLGEAATRLGLPAVVGELTAGIVLGPSLLDATTRVFDFAFPAGTALDPQFHLLEVVSWIGLLMLIVLTGLETDLDLIISRGLEAVVIAVASIAIPFAVGFAFGWVLPERYIAAEAGRLVFSLFLGTALSISAIPVIAKILMDMDVIRRDFSQIKLAAGMINDTLGWILLALVAGLARTGQVDLTSTGLTVLYLVVFLGVGLTVGQRVVRELFRLVDNLVGGQVAKITTLMVLSLAVGSFTHYLHLEAVLGAFVVGILVGQVKRFDYETEHTFEMMTLGIFAPIFFAIAGLRVDLWTMADPEVFGVAVAALVIAIVGKFVGAYLGAYAVGLSHWECITMGAGLNARGAMEIIVAMIGLGLGVLTIEVYSIIVVIAIVTSLMAPPMLGYTIPRLPMSPEERERLEREEREAKSFIGTMTTVLQPTRCSVDSQYAAMLLGLLTRDNDIEVTAMYLEEPPVEEVAHGRVRRYVDKLLLKLHLARRREPEVPPDDRPIPDEAAECLERMQRRFDPTGERNLRRIARPERGSLQQTVLRAAERDFDLLVIGTAERGARPDDPPFGDLVDTIIRDAPCPCMTVHANLEGADELEEARVERVLLPTTGVEFNKPAAEVAFAIARNRDATVEILHVVTEPRVHDRFVDEPDMRESRRIGEEIVDEEAELGREMGAEVSTSVVVSDEEPEDVIVDHAAAHGTDLIVMGTSVRSISRRAYLGQTPEAIIRNADAAVAVVASR
ncbi:MAG: cation:proton antiporter [Halobacteriales archaeon]